MILLERPVVFFPSKWAPRKLSNLSKLRSAVAFRTLLSVRLGTIALITPFTISSWSIPVALVSFIWCIKDTYVSFSFWSTSPILPFLYSKILVSHLCNFLYFFIWICIIPVFTWCRCINLLTCALITSIKYVSFPVLIYLYPPNS